MKWVLIIILYSTAGWGHTESVTIAVDHVEFNDETHCRSALNALAATIKKDKVILACHPKGREP